MKTLIKFLIFFYLVGFSGLSWAENLGLAYNEKFPTAAFPFARVVTGCTDWRTPSQLGDEWGKVSFKSACSAHDECFHSLNASWGECNQQFKRDLHAACRRDLRRARLGRGQVGEPEVESLKMCFDIADMYFGQVQKVEVIKKFEFAQKMQRAYLRLVFNELTEGYKSIMGRDPSKDKILELFQSLMDGIPVTKVYAGIKSEQEINSNSIQPAMAVDTIE